MLYVLQELSYLNSSVCSRDRSLAQKCDKKAFLTKFIYAKFLMRNLTTVVIQNLSEIKQTCYKVHK